MDIYLTFIAIVMEVEVFDKQREMKQGIKATIYFPKPSNHIENHQVHSLTMHILEMHVRLASFRGNYDPHDGFWCDWYLNK